jgi:hypothetical protein
MKVKICIKIFCLFFLYGCETWPLTLREKHRLRVFENRLFRRKFGLKSDEVTKEWRKLHNEKLNDLYYSPNFRVIKSKMRWAGYMERKWDGRGTYRVLVGKPEGKETVWETQA